MRNSFFLFSCMVFACKQLGKRYRRLQMIAQSAECGCLSPATAQESNVNHKCTHGDPVVHTRALGIKSRPKLNAFGCFGSHQESMHLPVSDSRLSTDLDSR